MSKTTPGISPQEVEAQEGSVRKGVGPHLTFTDCMYTVVTTRDGKPTTALTRTLCAGSTQPKRLLKGITAEVKAGHVLAILGPSGAGKTTLLNMLTLEKKGGAPVGHLHLNGHPCNFETCAPPHHSSRLASPRLASPRTRLL